MKTILLLVILTSVVSLIRAPLNLEAADFSEIAREYRLKGYQAQRAGDVASAIRYYQKAIVLDPSHATAYNDLGIVYEAKGWLDKAEQAYLRALQIDPNYVDVYSNLALLYERRNDIDKAAFYWKKRIQLGNPGDLWTQKAWQKLDKHFPVQKHHRRAKSLFEEGECKKALEEIDKALKLAPEDEEIINLKKKIEIKINEKKIAIHCAQGMKYYRIGDYRKAGEEFKKMLELLPGED